MEWEQIVQSQTGSLLIDMGWSPRNCFYHSSFLDHYISGRFFDLGAFFVLSSTVSASLSHVWPPSPEASSLIKPHLQRTTHVHFFLIYLLMGGQPSKTNLTRSPQKKFTSRILKFCLVPASVKLKKSTVPKPAMSDHTLE